MKIINFFILILFFVSGCSNIEFVLQNNVSKSPLNNLVSFDVVGNNSEYFIDALIKNFGYAEQDYKFALKVLASEEKLKTSIGTNQVTSSEQYKISVSYQLEDYKEKCDKVVKNYEIIFTHYPKSEGYNFGSDQALQESYKSYINQNVFQYKNFIENNENIINCLNEN